ncbi:MAG: DNA cytosine methyltransferase [Bacteroidota bacterium]
MNTIDLFSGCGGMSLGFMQSGFHILCAYDNWKPAITCYEKNFDHSIKPADLSDTTAIINELRPFRIDAIIGGPPCQDFSHAGNRTEGKRADLTESFAIIVENIKPTWFVMENVDRIINSKAYAKARDRFHRSGYGLTEIVLDASYCDVPQIRKRFFCIGKQNEVDGFLNGTLNSRLANQRMTVKNYLGNRIDIQYYYRHPRNYNRRAIFSVDEPSPTIRGVNRPVPQGYNGHTNDPVQINPSIRPLNTIERSWIQTFPVSFVFPGTKTETEQLIGNAVPVNLAKYVADSIILFVQESINETYGIIKNEFIEWLIQNKFLKQRSARDVFSRLKRAALLVEIDTALETEDLMFRLSKQKGFKDLSGYLKSQIKRSIKLFIEFKELRQNKLSA